MLRRIAVAALAFVFCFAFTLTAAEAEIRNAPASASRKHTDAEYQAAFAYFEATNLARTQQLSLSLMLDNLVKSKPAMKEVRPVMEELFQRYLGYEALKYEFADLYLSEFTVDELKELTRITRNPAVSKLFAKQPKLMQAGSSIARKHLAPRQKEIRAAVKAFALRKAAEKAAAEAEKARGDNAAKPAAQQ